MIDYFWLVYSIGWPFLSRALLLFVNISTTTSAAPVLLTLTSITIHVYHSSLHPNRICPLTLVSLCRSFSVSKPLFHLALDLSVWPHSLDEHLFQQITGFCLCTKKLATLSQYFTTTSAAPVLHFSSSKASTLLFTFAVVLFNHTEYFLWHWFLRV